MYLPSSVCGWMNCFIALTGKIEAINIRLTWLTEKPLNVRIWQTRMIPRSQSLLSGEQFYGNYYTLAFVTNLMFSCLLSPVILYYLVCGLTLLCNFCLCILGISILWWSCKSNPAKNSIYYNSQESDILFINLLTHEWNNFPTRCLFLAQANNNYFFQTSCFFQENLHALYVTMIFIKGGKLQSYIICTVTYHNTNIIHIFKTHYIHNRLHQY